MYKRQMKLQKLFCLIAVCVSAAVFVYSLGIMTDLYDSLYSTMVNPNNLSETDVPGSYVYYEMQGFNQNLLMASIGLILLALLLFITNTNTRRKYYIGNYFASVLYAVAAVAVSVWGHIEIEKYKAKFLQIDFAALKVHADMWKTAYTESTFWFDIHYLLFALLIIEAGLLVFNLIWKNALMKSETELLSAKA